MSPLVGLGGARSFCLLHPLFRIDTEYQPHRHLVAVCQLQNYIRDLPRIAFRTLFEASQHLEYRTDRCLRQQVRRILPSAPCPVGSNTSRLECADLDPERRDFHRQRVAKTADSFSTARLNFVASLFRLALCRAYTAPGDALKLSIFFGLGNEAFIVRSFRHHRGGRISKEPQLDEN